MRVGAKRIKGLDTSRLSPLQLEEIPEPELPTPEWVRVKPLLSGICGSDLGTLSAESSPYFSPITSPPFVMGHEVFGVVAQENSGFSAGERVVVEPALGCAVHAALKLNPGPNETTLVIGAGSVGLFVVAALKQLTNAGPIICVAKYTRQEKEASRLGADEVLHPEEAYEKLPTALGAERYRPELGKPVVMGGADKVFECVGAPGTIEDAVRLCAPGGEVACVGMPGARSCLDLTALWHKEVNLLGTYAYGVEEYRGERVKSFELALRIAPEIKVESLVGPHFRLREYREAIASARLSGPKGHIKVVFDHRS